MNALSPLGFGSVCADIALYGNNKGTCDMAEEVIGGTKVEFVVEEVIAQFANSETAQTYRLQVGKDMKTMLASAAEGDEEAELLQN